MSFSGINPYQGKALVLTTDELKSCVAVVFCDPKVKTSDLLADREDGLKECTFKGEEILGLFLDQEKENRTIIYYGDMWKELVKVNTNLMKLKCPKILHIIGSQPDDIKKWKQEVESERTKQNLSETANQINHFITNTAEFETFKESITDLAKRMCLSELEKTC